jgi:hypothetical protein
VKKNLTEGNTKSRRLAYLCLVEAEPAPDHLYEPLHKPTPDPPPAPSARLLDHNLEFDPPTMMAPSD